MINTSTSKFWIFVLIVVIALGLIGYCKNTTKENIDTAENYSITKELLDLEKKYAVLLSPISTLKTTQPKTYWFIVSWLGTNYNTPKWKGYNTEGWKKMTKERGIDCSGFARVMQDEIFNKKIKGGSQGIFNRNCIPSEKDNLVLGDLVFFHAPGAKNHRIVHVGVYLIDGYFVHATSTKSASMGLGLNINSLQEKRWKDDFVMGCKVKA